MQVVELQQGVYKYQLPPLPKEEEIWYYDLPKKEQYWKTPSAKNFKWLDDKGQLRNVKHMDERSRIEYIQYWRHAWEHGLYIMINGEPTYLTGAHIDHLVFNKFKNRNLIYLDAQRERFYFRDLTNKDPKCDGRIWAKGRRVGITAEQITENIRVMLSDFSNHTANQSDTHDKAKSTLLSKIIETYVRRPEWARETFYSPNGKMPRATLELIDVTVRHDDNYPLGSTSRAFPSTPKALDGEEFMLVTMDELSKWEGCSPYETYEINKKTIVNPDKRGKMDCLSTTGDSKEAQKAVKDWHQLIADSNYEIKNANGQTNSGLWRYFVSYIHSLELLERFPDIKDVYGKINRDKAEQYIWNEIKKYPKDSKEYIYALYKMPMELRHTLLTPTGQGYFSKVRIANRLDELRNLPNDKKPYVRGRLEYADAVTKKEVEFIPDENGHWLISLLPYFSSEKNIDIRNRFKRSYEGVFFPPVNPEGAIGYDPIRYKKEDTTSNSLSQAAIIVYKKLDYFGAGDSEQYCGLYLFRPDDPRTANIECIKAAKFWGYPVMHERIIESVKEDFEEENCLPFLLKSEKDDKYGLWVGSDGKVVKNAVDMMVTRFSNPKNPEDIDQISAMPFEHCLMDMDLFDISNTTKFDTFMAMVELEHGLKQIQYTNLTEKSVSTMSRVLQELNPTRR